MRRQITYHYRPWKSLLGILFLLLLFLVPQALLLGLDINNSSKVYFPEDAPGVVIDERLRQSFPNDQVIALLFEGDTLFADDFIEPFHGLARTLQGHPLVHKIWSATTVDHISGSEDGFSVAPLIDATALDETSPDQRRVTATTDRFARGRLVAEDGSGLALVVVPQPIGTSMQSLELHSFVLDSVEQAGLSPRLTAVAGQLTVEVEELYSMFRDNLTFIPLTVGIGLLLVWWLFRRLLAVLITGVCIGSVVSATVAIYTLVGQPFNLVSTIIPPLLSALTVAALVHLYNAIHYAARHGLTGPERVARALAEVRRPALFTALTTAAGLASLGTSPVVPVATFGMIAAVGVLLLYLVVIHAVPHIMARWDRSPWPHTEGGLRWMDRVVRQLYQVGIRHPVAVVATLALLLGLGSPFVARVTAETSLQEFFQPDHPIRLSTQRFQDRLSGTMPLDVVFETAERDGLKAPERLRAIRDFQQWVERLPEVDESASAADIIEEMNWGFHEEDPSQRTIPADPRLVSQYLFIYDGTDLYDFIDRDFRITRVALSLNVHGASEISQVMDRIRPYLREHMDGLMQWDIAGDGRLFADMSDLLITGQVYSLWGALILIFVLMILLWRSVWDSLLCMIPNLSPVLLIFILMGILGIWLDMATAMIASVAVGIAVDDTIHLYHGFIHRMRSGVSPLLALVRTLHQAGRAIVTTTLILCAQFMILVTSQFVPTTHFGVLTSIGLLAALVFDMLMMPALLVLIYMRRPGAATATTTAR